MRVDIENKRERNYYSYIQNQKWIIKHNHVSHWYGRSRIQDEEP